jgi:hypothetical protein
MQFRATFSAAFLCGLLVLSIMISGCTSADTPAGSSGPAVSADTAAMAGLYKSVDDQNYKLLLEADGKATWVTGEGRVTGTFTKENGEVKVCAEEKDGRTCIYAPIQPDGSILVGTNIYRQ